MISTILNWMQLLLIVVTPFVLFTLIIHRIERFTQHRLATRFGWKSILWTGWLGTPIHELSHVAMCVLFRHRIDDVALFEPDLQSGRLGYVRHSFTKANRFQRIGNVFIGLAPLVGGALALGTLLWLFYPDAVKTALLRQQVEMVEQSTLPVNELSAAEPSTAETSTAERLMTELSMSASVTNFFNATTTAAGSLFRQIFNVPNMQTKRFWCFLYLTLCVGSHMAPSRSDYAGARHGVLLLTAMVAAGVLLVSMLGLDSVSVAISVMNVISPVLAVMVLALLLCSVAAVIIYSLTILFPVRHEIR